MRTEISIDIAEAWHEAAPAAVSRSWRLRGLKFQFRLITAVSQRVTPCPTNPRALATYARATLEYDNEHERVLIEAITRTIFEASVGLRCQRDLRPNRGPRP